MRTPCCWPMASIRSPAMVERRSRPSARLSPLFPGSARAPRGSAPPSWTPPARSSGTTSRRGLADTICGSPRARRASSTSRWSISRGSENDAPLRRGPSGLPSGGLRDDRPPADPGRERAPGGGREADVGTGRARAAEVRGERVCLPGRGAGGVSHRSRPEAPAARCAARDPLSGRRREEPLAQRVRHAERGTLHPLQPGEQAGVDVECPVRHGERVEPGVLHDGDPKGDRAQHSGRLELLGDFGEIRLQLRVPVDIPARLELLLLLLDPCPHPLLVRLQGHVRVPDRLEGGRRAGHQKEAQKDRDEGARHFPSLGKLTSVTSTKLAAPLGSRISYPPDRASMLYQRIVPAGSTRAAQSPVVPELSLGTKGIIVPTAWSAFRPSLEI